MPIALYPAGVELGPPISYEVLQQDTPVYSSDGHEIGKVAHVLAVEDADVFDGIVISEHLGSHGHRFADADDIGEIHEHGVLLKLDRAAAEQLPEPTANPAVMRDDPAAGASGALAGKLRRAWDYISGNY
jgi:uncharacterized protein YrrD